MKKCKYHREERPSFISVESEGFVIEMIPVCLKQGLRDMGAPSDVVFCNGDIQRCSFKELSHED